MGFTLKKIISTFLMPLSLGLLLFIVGLFYLYRQSYSKAKFFLTISFLWIVTISYAPFSNALLNPLESQYQKVDLNNINAKYILLLGGYFEARAYEVIRLHNHIHNSKIITSGYPGAYKTVSEAQVNAKKLMELGIKEENILMQNKPKDTQEEAKMIRDIIGNENFILVTSAYHMPRAMDAFTKEGLKPIPAPTNYLINPHTSLISIPSGGSLQKTEIALHEYLGLLWYKIKEIVQ